MTLPILYKQNKNGSIQTWQVSTDGATITVQQGQLDGKLQTYTTECSSRNIGKSNETTPEQQAALEAQSKYIKQLDRKGYSLDLTNLTEKRGPMLVNKYQKHHKKLNFPHVMALNKLNGLNGIYRLENDVLTLWSRGLKEYPPIPHLNKDVLALMKRLGTDTLAGELYHHGTSLQTITSWVKKPKTGSENLEFHVFDCPDLPGDYTNRTKHFGAEKGSGKVHIIPRVHTPTQDLIDPLHTKAVADGYEGLVIFNMKAMYEYGTRSLDVLKYKIDMDEEFKVISYTLDKLGHPVYTCETKEGLPFSVKRKGTASERLADATIADSNIGKWLNVSFEMYSDEGKPLKPVGNEFRECGADGTPLS